MKKYLNEIVKEIVIETKTEIHSTKMKILQD